MNNKRPSYIPEDQWIEDLPSYVLQVAHQHLPLNRFWFYETYRDENLFIMNSSRCRVRFYASWESYNQWEGNYEVIIHYGRLHAPDGEFEMLWQGERCQCWLHPSWNYILEFINETFFGSHKPSYSDLVAQARQKKAEFRDNIHRMIAFEAKIWKQYAPHLFELFDLRRPDLWEQYRFWLKARYIAEGRSEEEDERMGLIPYYRVC